MVASLSPSTGASPLQLGSDIAAAIAVKTLQAQKQQGAGVLQLLQSAVTAEISSVAGDPLVAKATGLGSQLDINA